MEQTEKVKIIYIVLLLKTIINRHRRHQCRLVLNAIETTAVDYLKSRLIHRPYMQYITEKSRKIIKQTFS